ncbi:MAG: hypothetical protein WB919_00170 [Candidatus Sulfotelmatobacter sp.]
MKDVMELLRAKEQELLKVRRQVEALRVALPLLRAEDDSQAREQRQFPEEQGR